MARLSFSRRELLANTLATAGFVAGMPGLARAGSASPQCPSVSDPATSLPPLTDTPLGTIAASKNLLLGAQLGVADNQAYGPGMYDTVYQQVVVREKPAFIAYGSAFKFDSVCPDPPDAKGNLVFTQKAYGVTDTWYVAEQLTSAVMGQGFRARADALIWNGVATAPSWLMPLPANATTANAAYKSNVSYLVKYIQAAISKMTSLEGSNANLFHAACIVNEPILPNFANPQSPTPATFRDGPWLPPGQLVGTAPKVPDYIVQAFTTAQNARATAAKALKQPAITAKFFVNEALCETDQFGPVMRPALLALLKAMLAAKLNVQAVRPGMPSAAADDVRCVPPGLDGVRQVHRRYRGAGAGGLHHRARRHRLRDSLLQPNPQRPGQRLSDRHLLQQLPDTGAEPQSRQGRHAVGSVRSLLVLSVFRRVDALRLQHDPAAAPRQYALAELPDAARDRAGDSLSPAGRFRRSDGQEGGAPKHRLGAERGASPLSVLRVR